MHATHILVTLLKHSSYKVIVNLEAAVYVGVLQNIYSEILQRKHLHLK